MTINALKKPADTKNKNQEFFGQELLGAQMIDTQLISVVDWFVYKTSASEIVLLELNKPIASNATILVLQHNHELQGFTKHSEISGSEIGGLINNFIDDDMIEIVSDSGRTTVLKVVSQSDDEQSTNE